MTTQIYAKRRYFLLITEHFGPLANVLEREGERERERERERE